MLDTSRQPKVLLEGDNDDGDDDDVDNDDDDDCADYNYNDHWWSWQNGEAVIFDTSIIHSTRNDADRDRDVLLIR